jgi:hypothetical protein
MTDNSQQQIRELIADLIQFTHELTKVGGEGEEVKLSQLKRDIHGAAFGFLERLVALNDGKDPREKARE